MKGQHSINLPNAVPKPTLNFDVTTSAKQWQRVSSDSSFSTASFPNSLIIQDVPGFCTDYTGGSDVKGSNQYPDYLGDADDYYHDYDGCAPYAGAMVLGYHEGITVYDWNARNRLIDKLHYHMDTGDDIYTDIDKIAPGIDEYSDDTTDYLYNARTDKSFSKSDMKNELYSGRPALLTMWDGGSPEEDGYENYDNHTVAVEGYEERTDGLYWAIHDSYEYQRHWIANNNWDDADATYVERV